MQKQQGLFNLSFARLPPPPPPSIANYCVIFAPLQLLPDCQGSSFVLVTHMGHGFSCISLYADTCSEDKSVKHGVPGRRIRVASF